MFGSYSTVPSEIRTISKSLTVLLISVVIRDKIRLLEHTSRLLLVDFVSLSNSLTFCFTFKLITYLLKVLLSFGVFWFIFWGAVPACIIFNQNTSFFANWTQLIINVSHFFTFLLIFTTSTNDIIYTTFVKSQ